METQTQQPQYRVLPKTFRSQGWDFEQIQRTGSVAIYYKSRRAGGWDVRGGRRVGGYEVIKVRWSEGGHRFPSGKVAQPGELYPSDCDWGTYGWSYNDLAGAMVRFESLLVKPATT